MWDFKRSFLHNIKDPDNAVPVKRRGCDIPGCPEKGEYRAPKSRYQLNEYFWFCLEHVRQYNANWDYFKGMTPGEVEQQINRANVWDRPTWRSTEAGAQDDAIKRKIYEHFAEGGNVFGKFSQAGEDDEQPHTKIDTGGLPHPTLEALETMQLEPPVDWAGIRAQYKKLVKKYHPDANSHDKNAEEHLKKINMAYTILKLSYQQYATLDDTK